MAINIQKFDRKTYLQKIKFLIYGESGVGKTTFASTFPDPLFLDTEHGLASLQSTVDYITIDNPKIMEEAIEFAKHTDKYQTIVVDSVTRLQNVLMDNILEDYPDIKRPYDSLPTMNDYNKLIRDFTQYIYDLIALDKLVVLIGVNTAKSFEEDVIQPAFTGRMTSKLICAAVDMVGYMFKVLHEGETKHVLSFDMPNFVTKCRIAHNLPRLIQNPTYPKILSYMEVQNGNQFGA